MEPEKRYRPGTIDTRLTLEKRVETLFHELAVRDAEIKALRESLDLVYTQWVQRDEGLQMRLRDLQAQVDAVETKPSSPNRERTTRKASLPLSSSAYQELIVRIRNSIRKALPRTANVLVISRGDEQLLALEGKKGGHFPQREDGVYAGYYPAESTEAIAHLERLRAQGAEYLVIPSTSLWWLDYYKAFADYLQSRYKTIVRQDDTCWVFDLNGERKTDVRSATASTPEEVRYQALKGQILELVSVLLPSDAVSLVISKGDEELVKRCGDNAQHFPQGPDGGYAGYHPSSSDEAIIHLENLRQQGAEFLLFPSTAFWWLDFYQGFREHLEDHYPVVCRQQHLCLIFALNRRFSKNGHSRTGNP